MGAFLRSLGRAASSFSSFVRNNWLSIVAVAALLTIVGLAIFPPAWLLLAATILSFGFVATTGAAVAGPLALVTVSAITGACVYAAGSIAGLIGRAARWAFSPLFSAGSASAPSAENPVVATSGASPSSTVAINDRLVSGAGAMPLPTPTSGGVGSTAAAVPLDRTNSNVTPSTERDTQTSSTSAGAKKPAGGWHIRGFSAAALLQRFGWSSGAKPTSSEHTAPGTAPHEIVQRV